MNRPTGGETEGEEAIQHNHSCSSDEVFKVKWISQCKKKKSQHGTYRSGLAVDERLNLC